MDKSRDEILDELYKTGFVENYVKQLAKANDIEFLDDEKQEIWLIICKIPDKRIIELYNGDINNVRKFVSGVIHRQMKSVTSSIHTKYRRHTDRWQSTTPMTVQQLEDGLNNLENEYVL